MLRKFAISLLAVSALVAPALASGALASTPNAKSMLTKALSDAAHESSMTVSGLFKESGQSEGFDAQYDSVAVGGSITVGGAGTADIEAPNSGSYVDVKGSSLIILNKVFEVKSPTSAEIGVWYKVTKADPRFDYIDEPGGATTIAQTFSYSAVGWSRATTYDGTTTLKGVRVNKMSAASNFWVEKGFGKLVLYVTDNAHPLPFAMSGPPGSSGLCYFSKWGSTEVPVLTTTASLPQ